MRSSTTPASNVARTTTADADLIAQYPACCSRSRRSSTPRWPTPTEVGNQPVGTITADITTAFTGGAYADGKYAGGTRDDRGSESTLGDLVANALRDGLPAEHGPGRPRHRQPGRPARRAATYAGDTAANPANTDGVVTYAEANASCRSSTTSGRSQLTGAQLKARARAAVAARPGPPRPFLELGLSDNVRVTQDAEQAARVSGSPRCSINGEPLDPAKTYTVSRRSPSSAPAVTTSPRSRRARPRTPVWSTATCGSAT